MSKRRHNFGTKRFKEKSLFIFHARIALKSLILLFVRLIARGARIGKTHTHTQTDRQTDRTSTVTLAHARRGLIKWVELARGWGEHDIRISVPFMRDTTRARARKYGKDAGLSPSSTHVRQ